MAYPNNKQQVVPKVDAKIVASVHIVIFQHVCIGNAAISGVHLHCIMAQPPDFRPVTSSRLHRQAEIG